MSKGFGKTIGRRIRIRQSDDASASCSGSSRLDPPSASSACTVRFTTPSTFNVISSPDPHCGSSGPKLPQSGKIDADQHGVLEAQFGGEIEIEVGKVVDVAARAAIGGAAAG